MVPIRFAIVALLVSSAACLRKRKARQSAWEILEMLMDTTIADADTECEVHNNKNSPDWADFRGLSKARWDKIFDTLDVDHDGTVTPADLSKAAAYEASESCEQLTKEDVRNGLALVAEHQPKLAPYLLKHSQLVLYSAWTGRDPPLGSPEPSRKELMIPSHMPILLHHANVSLVAMKVGKECVWPLISLTMSLISIWRVAIGAYLPSVTKQQFESALKRLLSRRPDVLDKIIKRIPDDVDLYRIQTIMACVMAVGSELWKSGLISDAVYEAFESMGWWEWIQIIVPFIAAIVLAYSTGGAINGAAAMSMIALNMVWLTAAIVNVNKKCK